jgi:hypothetical protein
MCGDSAPVQLGRCHAHPEVREDTQGETYAVQALMS